jgi:hypothetical protein
MRFRSSLASGACGSTGVKKLFDMLSAITWAIAIGDPMKTVWNYGDSAVISASKLAVDSCEIKCTVSVISKKANGRTADKAAIAFWTQTVNSLS